MKHQRGSALMLILMLVGVLGAFFAIRSFNDQRLERATITSASMAQAKQALLGFANSVDLATGNARPGDLPCPDQTNTGIAATNCGNASGSTGQALRLGRLPWKTLGLPDLRDSSGERLWYAVSNNFKRNTRTTCSSPGMAGCLNSDTVGTISIRDASGVVINNSTATTGVIAVIFAPGKPLTRQDGVNQIRDVANENNPINYLDVGNGEDNASFIDTHLDGFINGVILDANSNTLVNDQLLTITYDDLVPSLENRVAQEVLSCFKNYAADPQNQGRLPWAADTAASAGNNYADTSGNLFGRLPDTFSNTVADSSSAMKSGWTFTCNLNGGSWWNNWKELVFYAIADAYKPMPTPPAPVCGSCLTINPPSAVADKQAAIFLARKRLAGVAAGQPRTSIVNKSSVGNYLENQNATPLDNVFEKATLTSTFNDLVLFLP